MSKFVSKFVDPDFQKLFIECCIELERKRINGGSWINYTMPTCFVVFRNKYLPLNDDSQMWFPVLESYLQICAVEFVARLNQKGK